MPVLRVVPLEAELQVPEGETVMGAAQAQGYYWPTTCGGEGRCTTCACEVLEGGEALSPMGRAERKTLVEERGERVLGTAIRLACQARIERDGAIVVRKAGVRTPGPAED